MNMCNRWSPIQLYCINTHRIDCHCYEFITFAMVHSDFSPDAIRHQQSERGKKHELTMFCTFAGWSAVIVIYNNLNDFAVFIIISRMKMTQCNIAVNIVLVCMSTIQWTAIDFAAAKRHFICCHFLRFWFVCARQPQFNLLCQAADMILQCILFMKSFSVGWRPSAAYAYRNTTLCILCIAHATSINKTECAENKEKLDPSPPFECSSTQPTSRHTNNTCSVHFKKMRTNGFKCMGWRGYRVNKAITMN